MGCSFSKENWCFSLTCCFCMRDRPACYWIGGVGLVWGGFATLFDFISANLPNVYCTRCIDYNLNHYLGLTSGGINAIQWVMSCFLIHGARKEIRWMVGVWLAWATVSIVMQLLWFCITLPYTPSVRGFASFFQLVWGIHYFIVIKTHFTRMSLTFTPPEEPLKLVPPNSPTKKHRRHKRRIDQTTQPPIRTLLGAAIKIQGERTRGPRATNEVKPRGPPSPVSPSHADVMVHWKLEMPQEDDPETSSEASLSPSPPPVRPPQRRPREDPAAVDGRRRPPSSPTDTGVFARTPNEEGKREKFRIIEVKRKSQTIPGEPRAKTCSRRTSYKLAVGSPDTQETEIV
ncbi:hypothetical protein C7M84_014151 [Penaeus vannamei]|uniref:Uncharacterized protein n=1 Tax=Penaeus vannamei TaxID=6689 RepID=A0A3R7LY76_PENVA|nr:hypothetical protein C7M84_014151 [Penaeus vannamei]